MTTIHKIRRMVDFRNKINGWNNFPRSNCFPAFSLTCICGRGGVRVVNRSLSAANIDPEPRPRPYYKSRYLPNTKRDACDRHNRYRRDRLLSVHPSLLNTYRLVYDLVVVAALRPFGRLAFTVSTPAHLASLLYLCPPQLHRPFHGLTQSDLMMAPKQATLGYVRSSQQTLGCGVSWRTLCFYPTATC